MPRTIIDVATGQRTPAPYTETVDNGDGTGTRTTYAPDGTITNTETVVIPDPTPEPPDRLTELEDMVRAQAAIIDDLLDALGGDDGPED